MATVETKRALIPVTVVAPALRVSDNLTGCPGRQSRVYLEGFLVRRPGRPAPSASHRMYVSNLEALRCGVNAGLLCPRQEQQRQVVGSFFLCHALTVLHGIRSAPGVRRRQVTQKKCEPQNSEKLGCDGTRTGDPLHVLRRVEWEPITVWRVSWWGTSAKPHPIGSHAAIIQGRVKAQGVWRLLICHLVEEKSHE
jgi:hypothetical protein